MSIVTKTGDDGTTGLMYNRRVRKTCPQVEAYGAVDELNAALGLARAHLADPHLKSRILSLQKELINLMGELATASADYERYKKDGYGQVTADMVAELEKWVTAIETKGNTFKGWAMPGGNLAAAALDVARVTCRRAERQAWALKEAGDLPNAHLLVYLNRLADLLWLLAREAENTASDSRLV